MNLLRFIPISFFKWCEFVWPGVWLKDATWVFAITETIHIMVLTVLLGTIFVVDLRLLGFGLKRRSAAQLARDLMPWTLTSIILMALTGVALFMSEARRLSQKRTIFLQDGFPGAGARGSFHDRRRVHKASAAGGLCARQAGGLPVAILLVWRCVRGASDRFPLRAALRQIESGS